MIGNPPDYREQTKHNEKIISDILQQVRPDIWVLMDLLDTTNINPYVVFKFLRQVNNIMTGSRWGQVTLVIADGVAKYMRGEDTDKIEENCLIPPKEIP